MLWLAGEGSNGVIVYLASVYLGAVFGAILGGLIGFVVQLATNQEVWALVVGSLGACLGAFWAGLRRADGQPIWRVRPAQKDEPVASAAETLTTDPDCTS